MEAGALEVVPDTVDLIGFLAGYTARIPPGPTSYYINDRFLLTVPDELAESLLNLYANATSPYSVLLISPAPPSVAGRNNSDTAFGYRDTWYIWVWPFWLRTAGGAAVDGEQLLLLVNGSSVVPAHKCVRCTYFCSLRLPQGCCARPEKWTVHAVKSECFAGQGLSVHLLKLVSIAFVLVLCATFGHKTPDMHIEAFMKGHAFCLDW